jgi:hypothetical protein
MVELDNLPTSFQKKGMLTMNWDRKKRQWKEQRGKAVIHRAIGKVGWKTDETKSAIEAKKATKYK